MVKIHGVDEHSEICGTGFFVDPTGTLYTAYTVGGEAGNFTVEFGGKKYPARQLVADIRSGTAILKVDETTPALPLGKSEELELATPVISIGYPLDLPKTPNFGMDCWVRPEMSRSLFFHHPFTRECSDPARRGWRSAVEHERGSGWDRR